MESLDVNKVDAILKGLNTVDEESLKSGAAYMSLENIIDSAYAKKAVLGIDIYRYSQYPKYEQALIPYLFKFLLEESINNCLNAEKTIFKGITKDDIMSSFIDTGDGGFIILDNPLQCIILAIYFQGWVKRYNTKYKKTQGIYNMIGDISLRYALTLDLIFKYRDNFYGPAIINNARMMSKDKLNRFLIDDNVFRWFNCELNGVENLQTINIDDFKYISILNDNTGTLSSNLFENKGESGIFGVDILHIGDIKSKNNVINIHSLHIQVVLMSKNKPKLNYFNKYTVTLGNLNTTGISD